ncbi:hypothetical protein EDC63_1121 [Sulfurirhabdus autotrophica]|uniref:Uncharacterized protein n=1 Tax=Sulfurirhabdus autotrophica TaxID=1706046 RepID=A0A4R3Y0S3_9PROT|nr:hypothetical protein EDC63_1121 [Sulfurirhabdus autotrophica]
MIVWITHAKVGHRQASILKTPPSTSFEGFFIVQFSIIEFI